MFIITDLQTSETINFVIARGPGTPLIPYIARKHGFHVYTISTLYVVP